MLIEMERVIKKVNGQGKDLNPYDSHMTTYINTIVAYSYLYNDYLEELKSDRTERRLRADQFWLENVSKLERNIKTAFKKLVNNRSQYVGQAVQIFDRTIRDKHRINIYGLAEGK